MRIIKIFVFLLLGAFFLGDGWSAPRNISDTGWELREHSDRIFYLKHGEGVWGHEFGFTKHPSNCQADTLWFVFSSSDEGVKDYLGKEAVISVDVDGKAFTYEVPMLAAETIAVTHIMIFTNLRSVGSLVDSLKEAELLRVAIKGPPALKERMDIKEDHFFLEGFDAIRREAFIACRALSPGLEDSGEVLAIIRE